MWMPEILYPLVKKTNLTNFEKCYAAIRANAWKMPASSKMSNAEKWNVSDSDQEMNYISCIDQVPAVSNSIMFNDNTTQMMDTLWFQFFFGITKS